MEHDSTNNRDPAGHMPEWRLRAPLARGRTADVYAWAPGQVLKLFHPWVTSAAVHREVAMTRTARAGGLRVPAVGQVVQIGARSGIVYTRVDGPSMLDALKRRPWAFRRLARRLAELHGHVHAVVAPDPVPALGDVLASKISCARALSLGERRAFTAALHDMAAGDRLCHGDFHPDNVILGETETVMIDWADATRGRPAADVARTSIIVRGVSESDQIAARWLRVVARTFHDMYCARYFQLHPSDPAEYRRWLPLVAAARLSEEIPGQEEWLVSIAATLTP